jgi:hypothetical protein
VKSSRILVVALAVAAILAPTAAARPIDGPVNPAQADMRASVAQVLAEQRAAKAAESNADDGIDWATIGIGVGLTFVALGVITGVTHRIRVRQRRPRVA